MYENPAGKVIRGEKRKGDSIYKLTSHVGYFEYILTRHLRIDEGPHEQTKLVARSSENSVIVGGGD